jgi:hypothetical protein
MIHSNPQTGISKKRSELIRQSPRSGLPFNGFKCLRVKRGFWIFRSRKRQNVTTQRSGHGQGYALASFTGNESDLVPFKIDIRPC